MREPFAPGKLIHRIANADIESLTKNAVAAVKVPDHLGIGTACIQDNRITASCCKTTDLDMGNTMVYTDKGYSEADARDLAAVATVLRQGPSPGPWE